MGDSFTQISSQSWFSRIIESIKGILVGAVLCLIAVGVLFWNEGRAVKRSRDLAEGAGLVVPVNAAAVGVSLEGRWPLIALTIGCALPGNTAIGTSGCA